MSNLALYPATQAVYGILLEQDFVSSWSSCVAIVSRMWYRTWWGHCLAPDPFFYVHEVPRRVTEAAQRFGEPSCILFTPSVHSPFVHFQTSSSASGWLSVAFARRGVGNPNHVRLVVVSSCFPTCCWSTASLTVYRTHVFVIVRTLLSDVTRRAALHDSRS